MTQVAAVVVTYNSQAEIGACLDALTPLVSEIVVIDNASEDGTVDRVRTRPDVRLIANRENRGFAAAVNQGVRASSAPVLLLCNPDSAPVSPIEPAARAAAVHGGACGSLQDDCGNHQAGFAVRRFPSPAALAFEALGFNRLWPGNPINRRYRCLDHDWAHGSFVEQPPAAFFLVRRDVFDEVGGMDEQFHPVWFEDVDLCRKIYSAGHKIWYEPSVRVRHIGAHSVGLVGIEYRVQYWNASLLRYARKYFPYPGFAAVCAAVAAGSVFRMIAGMVTARGRGFVAAFAKVAWLSASSAFSGRPVSVVGRFQRESIEEERGEALSVRPGASSGKAATR